MAATSRITDKNVEQKLKELSDIMDDLINKDMEELVLNSAKYSSKFTQLANSSYARYNDQPNNWKRILEMLVNKGIILLLKSLWKSVMEAFGAWKAENEKDLMLDQPWEECKLSQPQIVTALSNCCDIITVMWNGSDIKEAAMLTRLYDGLAEFALKCLDINLQPSNAQPNHPLCDPIEGYLTIIRNFCDNHDAAIMDLRKKNALQIVGKYRSSKSRVTKVLTFFTLSQLLLENGSDNDSDINLQEDDVDFIKSVVQDALDYEDEFSTRFGFHAEELFLGLKNIAAKVGRNKPQLMNSGLLPLYVKAMQKAKPALQEYAAEGVWALAFDENNIEKIKEEAGLMDVLHTLANSESGKLKKAARGALWKLEEEAKHVKEIEAEPETSKLCHIMISYQWDVQDEVLKVRERLRKEGYRVWIDVEQMSGHIKCAMAKAVEDAVVVVPVLTQKYKVSNSCRQELVYADKLRKRLVPLRMQPNYDADGWLGLIMGDLLYYDLTNPDDYEEKMVDFIRALGDDAKIQPGEPKDPIPDEGEDQSNGLDTPTDSLSSADKDEDPKSLTLPNVSLKCVSWSEEEVEEWLIEQKLYMYCEKFEGYDGEMLAELAAMLFSAPEAYYSIANKSLGFNFGDVLKLSVALRKLNSDS